MLDDQEFYTVIEFAEKSRIHPNTARKMIITGRIQAFRVGVGARGSYRIPKAEMTRICELDMMKLIEGIIEEKINKINFNPVK